MTLKEYIKIKDLQEECDRDIVGGLWYDSELSEIDKVRYTFELFESSPEYGICMEISMNFKDLEESNQLEILANYKRLLKFGDDKQKEQIEYSLWVDFFEDPETVDKTWDYLVDNYQDIELLRQLLRISGPVPFDKKDLVYMKLIKDKKNHESILVSLAGSFFDVYGQINIQRARILLPTLKVDNSNDDYMKLKDCLTKYDSQRAYWDSIKK